MRLQLDCKATVFILYLWLLQHLLLYLLSGRKPPRQWINASRLPGGTQTWPMSCFSS